MPALNIKNSYQSGRSMIEMLGVLAIIGVLSIGGIAGYSKAMTKYRVNKTVDQITQLAQNIRTLYASQKNYSTLGESVVKKAHLASEDMYENTSSDMLYNPFGGRVYVQHWGKNNSSDEKAFALGITEIPQEACVEIATKDWGAGSSSGLIAIGINANYSTGGVHSAMFGCTGNNYYSCAGDGVMSVDKAISLCASASNNIIGWKFY